MKKFPLIVALLGTLASQAQTIQTMLRLPDTGQTQHFTNTPGEDSDFSINPPFLIDNTNGTVTDTVTGLMWQQTDGGEMTIENAESYCENLVLGNFADWRLPSAQEAFSILNHGFQNPPLDPGIFTNTGAEYWWTSEKQAGNPSKIWVTNAGGGIGNHPKTETLSAGGSKKFHVRAVRNMVAPTSIPSQFTLLDSMVQDNLTGLEWQRYGSTDSMTWENALLFAQSFSLQGKTDWRLPNIKELQSINDETRSQPSISPDFFGNIGSRQYWASTSLPNQPTQAWFMDSRFGVISHELKTAQNSLLLVRGGNNESVETKDLLSDQPALEASPNPFSAHFFVKNAPANAVFILTNVHGKVIYTGKNPDQTDFSLLAPGVYCLSIQGISSSTLKLVKL